jgi:hypothetical protein
MKIALDNLRLLHSVTEGITGELNRSAGHSGWTFTKMFCNRIEVVHPTDKRKATLIVNLDCDNEQALEVDCKSDDPQFELWAASAVDNLRLGK